MKIKIIMDLMCITKMMKMLKKWIKNWNKLWIIIKIFKKINKWLKICLMSNKKHNCQANKIDKVLFMF